MMVVMIIKAAVSPYTPPPAYIAVAFQGILGEFIFRRKQYFSFLTVVFGVLTLSFSAFQKIFIYTLIFGYNLWEAVDKLGNYIMGQLSFLKGINSLSLWLIGIYLFIHLIVGMISGIIASKLPFWIEANKRTYDPSIIKRIVDINEVKIRKKKKFYKKKSNILIFLMITAIIVLSYVFPHFSKSTGVKAIIMVARYIVIMFIWLSFLSPWIIKRYKKYFSGKAGKYTEEIELSFEMFPVLKGYILYRWKDLNGERFFKKIKIFLTSLFIFVLYVDLKYKSEIDIK